MVRNSIHFAYLHAGQLTCLLDVISLILLLIVGSIESSVNILRLLYAKTTEYQKIAYCILSSNITPWENNRIP